MKSPVFALIFSILTVLVACSNDSKPIFDEAGISVARTEAAPTISNRGLNSQHGAATSIVNGERIQVSGSLSLEVQSLDEAIVGVQRLVTQYNGWVTHSNLETSGEPYAHITLLVPQTSFFELVEKIKAIASVVKTENFNSNDVTEEYIDVTARLDVMKETESRFLSLLSDTDNIEEIIQLEKELMRLRGEIDSLEGRVGYLAKTTDNSFLYLHLIEETSITGSKWDPRNSFAGSARNLISFSKHAADFLISLVVFLPAILVLVVVLVLAYRGLKKFRPRPSH
jgi:hypothetical protein